MSAGASHPVIMNDQRSSPGLKPGLSALLVLWDHLRSFSGLLSGEESTCQRRRCRRCRFDPWVGKIPYRREWQPAPVSLPGKSVDRGVWQTTVHGVTKSWTGRSDQATEQANAGSFRNYQGWGVPPPKTFFCSFKSLLNLLQYCFCFMGEGLLVLFLAKRHGGS